MREKLRGPAQRDEIGQQLIEARLRQRHIDRPGAVILLLRMDVLEEFQILADDEQVVFFFVDRRKDFHPFA